MTFLWTQSRDLERGEELLLRYNEDSDADFFAYACGLDWAAEQNRGAGCGWNCKGQVYGHTSIKSFEMEQSNLV